MTELFFHTNKSNDCFISYIRLIIENCDNEYYMSAMGSPFDTLERAERGRSRIKEAIIELEKIDKRVSCLACHQEIETQIIRQRNGVLEIESVWGLE